MNALEIVDGVIDKLEIEGFYSEMSSKELKDTMRKYIEREYMRKRKMESSRLKKQSIVAGEDASKEEYEKAHNRIEAHMLFITHDLAATSIEDLEDLKNFI